MELKVRSLGGKKDDDIIRLDPEGIEKVAILSIATRQLLASVAVRDAPPFLGTLK